MKPRFRGLVGASIGTILALSGAFYAGHAVGGAAKPRKVDRFETIEADIIFAKRIVLADEHDSQLVESATIELLEGNDGDAAVGSAYLTPEMFKLDDGDGHVVASIQPGSLRLLGEKRGRLTADADGTSGRAEIRLFQGSGGRDYSVIAAGERLEAHKPPK